MCEKYNGYTNYETWAVSLWMSNEEGTYTHYRDLAREILSENDGDKQAAIRLFADKIKNDHEEAWGAVLNPPAQHAPTMAGAFIDAMYGSPEQARPNLAASVWADLMGAALGAVNWYEISENQYSDIPDHTCSECGHEWAEDDPYECPECYAEIES